MTLSAFFPKLLLTLIAFAQAGPASTPAESVSLPPQFASSASASAMTVYVSDFDLDVVASRPSSRVAARTSPPNGTAGRSSRPANTTRKSPASTAPPLSPSSPSDADLDETPADRATALLTAVSESLLRALQQAGYNAQRLPHSMALPKTGLRIRGVFAEADERNRARRLLVGGEPVSPNMILFVGVNNLARPEQPLYELASPPIPDPRHGPVITVTSYAPAARFELSRDPTDEELKKISANIAADLTALVNANRLFLAE